jgi:hypothetical protein
VEGEGLATLAAVRPFFMPFPNTWTPCVEETKVDRGMHIVIGGFERAQKT